MKKRLHALILLFLILIASNFVHAAEWVLVRSLVVITDNRHPLQNTDVVQRKFEDSETLTIFNLDHVNALEKSISQDLPSTEQSAKREVLHRISTMGRDKFNTDLMNAYSGVFYALKNRINRYPVIVFNDLAVIYGVTDLQKALQLYQQWLKDQKVNDHE